jgi:hypothetical protein
MPNAHITTHDGWALLFGNPIPYLNGLRDGKTEQFEKDPARQPWPRGKSAFADFVIQNGGRAPRLHARLDGETADAILPRLKALPPGAYFCKPETGSNGEGALQLDVTPRGLRVDGKEESADGVAALLSSRPYVVQDSLVAQQHPDIAAFNPRVVNTLRLVTFDDGRKVRPAAAVLRIACDAAAVDNWSAGGVVVPIDLETGALTRFGVLKEQLSMIENHPVSGRAFAGVGVPHLEAALRLAHDVHHRLAAASIGWDIALLEDGPSVLEANRQWDIFLAAQLNPGFVQDFLGFHLPSDPGSTVRLELRGNFERKNRLRHWLGAVLGKALASGRVDALAPDRLVLSIGGPPEVIEAAIQYIRRSAAHFDVKHIAAARLAEPLRPGLDMAATFSLRFAGQAG